MEISSLRERAGASSAGEKKRNRLEAEAQHLIEEKRYKKALKKLLEAYDSRQPGRSDQSIYLIEELSVVYEPAREALSERRDLKESLVLSGKADRMVVSDWVELNESLNENERIFTVYKKVRKKKSTKKVAESLLYHVWKKLVKRGDYTELVPYFNRVVSELFFTASIYEGEQLFSSGRKKVGSKSFQAFERQLQLDRLAEDGPLIFELALGLGQEPAARAVASRILKLKSGSKVYAALVKHAIKAGADDVAKDYFKEAKRKLSKEKFTTVEKALKKALQKRDEQKRDLDQKKEKPKKGSRRR
ncbi:MAG: hypothetical protein H6677_13280 [Candidatus Obscuribacterales bacterium]|nr:hypothetical protein [Candidatus Obscuribacterales bacterium]